MPQALPAPATAPPPLDTAAARALTADELARLGAKAKVFGASYRVTVNNGNPNLTLTEVTIAVWDDTDLGATREEYSDGQIHCALSRRRDRLELGCRCRPRRRVSGAVLRSASDRGNSRDC